MSFRIHLNGATDSFGCAAFFLYKNNNKLLDELDTLIRVLNTISNHSACMQASRRMITHSVIPLQEPSHQGKNNKKHRKYFRTYTYFLFSYLNNNVHTGRVLEQSYIIFLYRHLSVSYSSIAADLYLNAVHVLLLRLEILRKYGYDSCAQPVF